MAVDRQHELLRFWLQDNREAVAFCEDVFFVSQVLDDLVDRDKPVTGRDVERMAMMMFSVIPRNPFYIQHRDTLQSYLETALMYWIDGNRLETQGEAGQRLAFVFRDIIGGVINKCALLIGGPEWWETISLDVHRRVTHNEGFAAYSRGLDG